MKTIIIPIRPEWACKILNGEKTIEVRKGLALYNVLKKAEAKGEEVEFLMYVTKAKENLWLANDITVINDGAEPDVNIEGRAITLGTCGKLEEAVYDMIKKRFPAAHRFGLSPHILNGKVVARFTLGKVEEIFWDKLPFPEDDVYCPRTNSLDHWHLNEATRLDDEQLEGYIKDGTGYALHISNLEIFDKSKTLADYGLKRAPRSWGYAKEPK